MLDNAWLPQGRIQDQFKGDVFSVQVQSVHPRDTVIFRLCSEINNWLGLPITNNQSEATIVFKIKEVKLANGGYVIKQIENKIFIYGSDSIALLYGFYALIRRRLTGEKISDESSEPDQPIRMIDQWDQIDGSVERGYADASIFFGKLGQHYPADNADFNVQDVEGDPFRHDRKRWVAYARMLSSVGINSLCLNNVNVRGDALYLITDKYLPMVKEIADLYTQFGIKIYVCVNWNAPVLIGKLDTSDPLNESVQGFWGDICKNIYDLIPNFGGFLVKADSEGEPGPYKYGRTHAQGANMLAKQIEPFGGLIIWRAFVYNSNLDWRDTTQDRALGAYENFHDLDGKFDENVLLQIKFGPVDFQPEEPINPLFGDLKATNQMVEFQVTAEYLGQQIDLNYSVPQWSKFLQTDTQHQELASKSVAKTIRETALNKNNIGFSAISNIGMDKFWTSNPLAQANLYGFGRLCWNNSLDPNEILHEWIGAYFGYLSDTQQKIVFDIMKNSNETYKLYTAPFGLNWMVDAIHYPALVGGQEFGQWGTYSFSDRDGTGYDRTTATGTGLTRYYSKQLSEQYENIETTPEELLLFFHHVNYDYVMKNGKTLIQNIYDQHFTVLQRVHDYFDAWQQLDGSVRRDVYERVKNKFELQIKNAEAWKDQINTYYHRLSGVDDEQGRKIYR